jgi:hypothetical protein
MHPEIILVTKSVPMALLRTCRAVNAEASKIVKSRLKDEPTRLLFDAYSLKTCFDDPPFLLLNEICWYKRYFESNTPVPMPTVEEVLQRGAEEDIVEFQSSRENFFEMSTHDPEYQLIRKFLLQCARYLVIGDQHSLNHAKNLCIGVRLPPGCSDISFMQLFVALHGPMAGFKEEEVPQWCITIKPGDGADREHYAKLHEELQAEIDMWRPMEESLYRVAQPTEDEWKREWEEGDV